MDYYLLLSFGSVFIFALVHLYAYKAENWTVSSQGKFLSFGSGVAIAYVFIDLLPKLGRSDLIVSEALKGVFPFTERHAFVAALLGFLLFYGVDRTSSSGTRAWGFTLSMLSYSLFNFFVGYAVVDKYDPEVQPLALFTFAMALHYFVNDYSLSQSHGDIYRRLGRWILIASLFLGWMVGTEYVLPEAAVALVSAFIGGGVIMNVIRHELPKDHPSSMWAFVLASFAYATILLIRHA